jgi:hypothetical protein
MHSISKFFALAVLAAGAATIASVAPSHAQVSRAAAIQPGYPPAPAAVECCQLATKTIATGSAGWTLKPPTGPLMTPIPIVPKHGLWAVPLPGSQWVGNDVHAGQAGEPGGDYVYEYHFCLCPLPGGIKTVPASLALRVWADDNIKVTLNNSPVLASHLTGWSFTTSPPAPPNVGSPPGGLPLSVISNYFLPCNNVLRFTVTNGPGSPTGLDVAGTISGYFQNVAPGKPCPCGPDHPYDGPIDPR